MALQSTVQARVVGNRVAVIGLGLTGIATLKNLLEEGFDAVGFERHNHIGGLWRCYPSGEQVAQYIEDYAKYFELSRKNRCQLGVRIDRIDRSKDGSQWAIDVNQGSHGSRTELFDRVVVTTGPFHTAFMPKVEGAESFKGKVLHAQEFKDPEVFKGQRVVVVGLSNTAADIAVDLSEVADKTYVSHRSGAFIITRLSNGQPLDHRITRRIASLGSAFNSAFPTLAAKLSTTLLARNMRKQYPLMKKSWGLLPARPILYASPAVNEKIMSCLESGTISSLPGIRRFLPDGHSIEFTNDVTLSSVDAVIFATGYLFDFSILGSEADPTATPTPEWDSSPNANGLLYPRLYQGIFSPAYSDSLAFIGPFRGHSIAAFSNADLTSQAITQVWKGNFSLPPRSEMESWCDKNYQKSVSQLSVWHIQKVGTDPKPLEKWLNAAAGNGLNEMLGWTSKKAWSFWWRDRKLYNLLMDGIDTPYIYRLFDGERGEKSRKKWDGARDAIFKTNGLVAQ
ncbi:putative dimethylaniline monooxygenase 2 [Phaeomoniella chlamydospora]|uniref:Putative dimethylaniline monooxygenase 2 n=1 Tax=Phaeomoniella chlamydospora TaxID=158046 RepID=A0A0G2DSZ7_PHACM|nr:putative dimethylaniline monooxygenase 2 [Phaeomoniella chlamydospora]